MTVNKETQPTVNNNQHNFQILAFCCTHCAYAAADLAGSLRLQYPPTIKIMEVPCTGKLDALIALEAFEEGVDGILVAG